MADTFLAALDAWDLALSKWAASARSYMEEIAGAGERVYRERWAAVVAATEYSPRPRGESLAAIMAAADALEVASRALAAASTAMTSKEVHEMQARGMSRTFSEDVKTRARALLTHERATGQLRAAALAAASSGILAANRDEISAAYSERSHGAVATELFAAVLAREGADRFLLSAAKDHAIGAPEDSPALAQADTEILDEYHPLQAMSYIPQVASVPLAALPRARQEVRYDLLPLIDRRQASQFGQLATAETGLNYRLVERLRTIRATPRAAAVPPGGSIAPHEPVIAHEPMIAHGPMTVWAPRAGSRPRVAAYTAAVSALAHQRIDEDGWTALTATKFEKLAHEGALATGQAGADAIIAAAGAAFIEDFDKTPPGTPKELQELVLGPAPPAKLPLGHFIARAVSRVGEDLVKQQLQTELASIGIPRVSFNGFAREARITQMRFTHAAIQDLQKRLRATFSPDASLLELPVALRRDAAAAAVRKALAAAMAAGGVAVAPPTLKMFAAARRSPR